MSRRLRYNLDALDLARSLLGQYLVRKQGRHRLSGRIVEVEAYLGPHDLASHTAMGRRTPRNESMYLGAGHAYVYLIYGMHHCFNITAGRPDTGAAVLVRAIEPVEGVEVMRQVRGEVRHRDLCRGPGRLSKALGISRDLDGDDLRHSQDLWVERGDRLPDERVICGPRVGLGQAGKWAEAPLRLAIRDCLFVSAPGMPQIGFNDIRTHEFALK
ncbi:MAG: DNA-3-methyladenine glycosylase [Phycisphaerales bacterium]|nr:DNA-3-methyladenine glycosylase [Phycisphaerales bacterium]